MREEYDFSETIKNPYTKQLRKAVTIRLNTDVIEYFKEMSQDTGLPYQTLINLYLKDCANSRRKLSLDWGP